MITLGLTGNRYSGKSAAVDVFKRIDVPVFDADLVLRFILNYNYELLGEIKNELGDNIFTPHSKNELILNFRRLNKTEFDNILDIVEDDVFNAYKRFNDKLERIGVIYTVFSSSILFEREWDKKLDMVANVFAPDTDRMKRCKYQTNMGLLNIKDLVSTEMNSLEKNQLSDFIINNQNSEYTSSSTISSNMLKQINQVDQKIIDEYIYKESLNLLV
jgi:dephospho-CoA kinase